MKAHYGYNDGSGTYYITIDSALCNGCEACVRVCPAAALVMVEDDPLEERLVAAVSAAHSKKIRYSCDSCKPAGYTSLPCVAACAQSAITHSW